MKVTYLLLALAACTKSPEHFNGPAPTMPVEPPPVAAPTKPVEQMLELSDVKLFVRSTPIAAGTTATTTIITIHGGPGISHEYMLPFERLASPTTRVVSYDQRGTGHSTEPSDPNNVDFGRLAQDIEEIRVAMHADKVDLVGHSYGGLIAMKYAIIFPAHTRSMILVDSLAADYTHSNLGFASLNDAIDAGMDAGDIPRPVPADVGDDCSKSLIAILPAYFADPHHPMTKHLAGSTCQNDINRRTTTVNDGYDLRTQLADVSVPTLVVRGDADPLSFYTAKTMTVLKVPPKVVELAKCGHVPFEECPEKLWPVIDAFLTTRP